MLKTLTIACAVAAALAAATAALAQPGDKGQTKWNYPVIRAVSQFPTQKYEEVSVEQQLEWAKLRDAWRTEQRDPNWRFSRPGIEWIDTPYHGEIFDGNFEKVEFDAATIDQMERSLFKILTAAVDVKAFAAIHKRDLDAAWKAPAYQSFDQLAARYYLLEDVMALAPDELQRRYVWRMALLERELLSRVLAEQYQLAPDILAMMREGLFRYRAPGPGQNYMEACRAKGVPTPPDFSGRAMDRRWKLQGRLWYTFISTSSIAEVYAYRDESDETPGTCVALPRSPGGRFSEGAPAGLIGVICQSSREVDGAQHACFWDNLPHPGLNLAESRLNGQDQPLRFGEIADGFSLTENCTQCHRGNNVFNIHPGTALDLAGAPAARGGPFPVAASWYVPIGNAEYANPPPARLPRTPASPEGAMDRSCTGCHDIGALSSASYCQIVADAAHLTMPPVSMREPGEGAAGWPRPSLSPSGRYRTHITALQTACSGTGAIVRRGPNIAEILAGLRDVPIIWRP